MFAVCVVAACATRRQPTAKEPTYQDRCLSEWLRDFDAPQVPQKEALAADALRHIGDAAMPLLIDYLSADRNERYKQELEKWQRTRTGDFSSLRPSSPRHEALAALDALAPIAKDALPALQRILREDPPDPAVLYVVARMGLDGVPLLTSTLGSTNKFLRLEARVCLDLMNSHSEVLYPAIPVGPDVPSFVQRTCRLNLEIMKAASDIYRAEHPRPDFPDNGLEAPPPPVLPK